MTPTENISKPKNYLWLDLLKGIAMIAVVVDHLFSYYQNLIIQYHTGFHVSLFILIAGFTSAISIQNRGGVVDFSYICQRIKKVFIPYLIATLVYCLYFGYFDLATIFKKIYTFSVAGPLYFVFFYIQLIAISYFVYKIINHQKSKILDIPLIIIFYLLSSFFNKYKIINSFYGGSGFLFGGSFFFLFVIGIFAKKYEQIFENKQINLVLFFASLILLSIYEFFDLVSKSWSNPANNYLIGYTLIVLSLVISIYQLFLKKFPNFLKPITIIGKNSLSVFLYHTLVIYIFSKIFGYYFLLSTFYFLLLLISLYLPILFSYLYKNVKLNLKPTNALN